ncbi:hypothetical protein RUM44_012067 [Polyplax serrata]|uniref:Origin recognition complex subunit 4 n=1 Tax=Polyplax serrata TaxID=468196 RepID=A0ABR1BEB0_POLSC
MSKGESDSSLTMRDMEIFNEIRNMITRKITNASGHYDDIWPQKKELYELIRRSVEFKESNSAILCAPPGCGKTVLVEHVIKELKEENVINKDTAHVIHLNGLLHTDDRLALKDIMRQLNVAEGFDCMKFSSFQENLVHLLEKLKEDQNESSQQPCVIFLLDEFHLFCAHKNQLLLYNLFDIVQSSKSPICVLGLTYYTDVSDLLEKRVLSRFSHRVIWLHPDTTIQERLKMFKNILTLSQEDLPDVDEIYKVLWNMRIDELIENKEVVECIKRQLDIMPSQTKFRNIMFKLFNTVTFEQPLLTADSIKSVFVTLDYYTLILSTLSMLEMGLVVAIKHHIVNYERESFNFEMIYAQYLKFCDKHSTTQVSERSVVLKGFQRLQELEIILPVKKTIENSLGKVPLEYRMYNFNLTEEQVSDGVKQNVDITTDLRQWALCAPT